MARTLAGRLVQQGKLCEAISLGREAFSNLERWLYSKKTASLGLDRIEVEEEQQGREVLRLMLEAHIQARGTGDVGPALRVSSSNDSNDGFLFTHKRLHTRRMVTIFGPVSLRRVSYGKPGHPSIHPLDVQLRLPARSYSYEMQRRLVKSAILGPFDEALEVVRDSTGVRVPKRSAELLMTEAGEDFESFYSQHKGAQTRSGPILVASIDSKGIPMVKKEPANKRVRLGRGEKRQKKRMSTVAAVFTQKPDFRTPDEVVAHLFDTRENDDSGKRKKPRPEHKRVWASLLTDKDVFINDIRKEMIRRDPRHRKTWVVVTDGERGLQRRVTAILKQANFTFVLDLLHVLQKLWAAAHVLHLEGSPEAEKFVRERTLRILRGGVSQVVKGLRQTVTKRRLRGQKRKTLLRVAAYYYRNRSRMRYDVYLKKGLPIASGSVEGACKNLVKDRMERSGMRWTPEMAEAMLRLRATYLSGDFEEYWQYHVKQEQERLYPNSHWCSATVVQK